MSESTPNAESSAATPLRIMLADDHRIFRQGLRSILEDLGGFEIVAECSDGESAVTLQAQHRPDVLILDLRMPKLDGLEVVQRVLDADPAARILIMTTFSTDQDIGRALRAGAKGYMLKDAAPDDLCKAVRRVADGGMFLAADVAEQYVRLSIRPDLSPRESQILKMIALGMPTKQIARDLLIEVSTVKGHLKSIYGKLDVQNRTEALAEGARRGIIRG